MTKKYRMINASNAFGYSIPLNLRISEGVNLRLTEEDEKKAEILISKFKSMTFKIDWTRLETEMGVNIPEEVRYRYEEMYKNKTLTGSSIIRTLSFVGIPFYVAAGMFMGNFAASPGLGLSGAVLGVIMLLYYLILQIIDWLDKRKKLASVNTSVISRIIMQMREGGVKEDSIKDAWGVAYQKIEGAIDWGEVVRIIPVFNAVLSIIIGVGFLLLQLFI